jgi:hypothetical protein
MMSNGQDNLTEHKCCSIDVNDKIDVEMIMEDKIKNLRLKL